MKKLFLILLFSAIANSQNLSLTGNMSLGQNCGQGQPTQTFTYQDVNLNGYTLELRNVNLQITNNLNGAGSIVSCGNPNQTSSSVCISGNIQNNPNINGLSCTLSTEKFELNQSVYGLKYKVYDAKGILIKTDVVNQFFYSHLPKQTLVIIEVENFKPFKLILNN